MKKVLVLLLLLCCAKGLSQNQSLTIFAASSLTESFTEIGREFSKESGVAVRFQFAGSQILRTQLENGAKADVFASADTNTKLEKILEPPQIFARNRLIVITPKRGLARVKTLADLAQPNVKLVIAQATVPVGIYTRQMLKNLQATKRFGANFESQVLKNVVSEESNVRQVALKVRLGEADAGVVYATDVTPELRANVIEIAIPERQNVVASYPIAVLREATNKNAARDFTAYVLGLAGQGILHKWGFIKKP